MSGIGVGAKLPEESCDDPKCPFHGTLAVRGRILQGTVIGGSVGGSGRTVTIRRDYLHFSRKYLRYERRRSSIAAHNPPCILAKMGDKVKVMECRPLSKTVSFVVIEKLGG
jgi:small subunit ribosomal protein S17